MNRFVSRIRLQSLGDALGPLRYLGQCPGCGFQFGSTAERCLPIFGNTFCASCAVLVEQGFALCAARLNIEHVDPVADRERDKQDQAFSAGYMLAFNAAMGWVVERSIAEKSGLKAAYVPRGGW